MKKFLKIQGAINGRGLGRVLFMEGIVAVAHGEDSRSFCGGFWGSSFGKVCKGVGKLFDALVFLGAGTRVGLVRFPGVVLGFEGQEFFFEAFKGFVLV